MTKYSFDISKVISWSNREEAKTYIGKTGYFNNDFESIKRAIELGALTVLEWLDSKRIDMHNAWKEQREIARQLRELTYKYEQSSDILSLMFGGYVGTASEVSHYLTDKLKQDS